MHRSPVGSVRIALGLAVAMTASVLLGVTAAHAVGLASTTPPSIVGAPQVGVTVAADPGTWDQPDASYTYQWLVDGTPVAGATLAAYTPTAADAGRSLSVVVTASKEGFESSPATAPPEHVLQGTLVNTHRPKIKGKSRLGATLTAGTGVWSPGPTRVAYQWLRAGVAIKGAKARKHKVVDADAGKRLAVRVTVKRPGYHRATAVSSKTARIPQAAPVVLPAAHTVTYRIETSGAVTADLATFARQAQETYDDPRGWRASGIRFRRVSSGGDFTLVLAEASRLPTFSSECSAEWSCRAGRFVVINQTRWLHASPMWNSAGLALRDYRHMVVNHETGHWLGHSHRYCPGPGALAPVMQQQSKGLQGCRPNPWPTTAERHTPRFG